MPNAPTVEAVLEAAMAAHPEAETWEITQRGGKNWQVTWTFTLWRSFQWSPMKQITAPTLPELLTKIKGA